jgi:UDPglucose 6-dehydrogenase
MHIQWRKGAYAVNRHDSAIGVVGLGYVGLAYALAFSLYGFRVVGIDINGERVEAIRSGDVEGFPREAIEKVIDRYLYVSTDYDDLRNTDVVFTAVNIPTKPDGSQDLSQVLSALSSLAKVWRGVDYDYRVVVVKSTVLPGTTRLLARYAREALGLPVPDRVGFVHSPEFLRATRALDDVLKPFRVVIGGIDEKSSSSIVNLFREFYRRVGYEPLIYVVSPEEAELIKYSSNVFLALKVVYANLIGLICREIGNCDAWRVMEVVGLDPRIGESHIMPGMPYGGPCLVKDVLALSRFVLEKTGIDFIKQIHELNERVLDEVVNHLEKVSGNLQGKNIAILGIAYTIGSSNVKDSQALALAKKLLVKGAKVYIHDLNQKAVENAKKELQNISVVEDYKQLNTMDLVIITLGYKEYEQVIQHINSNILIIDLTGTIKNEKVQRFYTSTRKG